MGGIWDDLGPLLGALGRFLAVFWAFEIKLFPRIGPRWGPRGLLERFWIDLGRNLGRFWERFGRFGELFKRIFNVINK